MGYPAQGLAADFSRGCGNSYVSLMAPSIWPEQARTWYALYTSHFWQEKWMAAGFREFPSDLQGFDWHMDVDAGPVVKGFGFAACAFGAGAARVNGHFEHAYPLTAEMLAVSCPLVDGTLLLPSALSNATDAPYLGEVAILYILTRTPAANTPATTGGSLPLFVPLFLALQALTGAGLIWGALWGYRRWARRINTMRIPLTKLQWGLWICLGASTIALLACGMGLRAFAAALAMQFFPIESGRKHGWM
jgi:hypothetical protein